MKKLETENKELKEQLREAKKSVEDLAAKVQYNEQEHASLIEEYSKLEKRLAPRNDSKKDK